MVIHFYDKNLRMGRNIHRLVSFVSENAMNRYTQQGNVIGTDMHGNPSRGEIVADITTSFMILLGIYFPSCTGEVLQQYSSHGMSEREKRERGREKECGKVCVYFSVHCMTL